MAKQQWIRWVLASLLAAGGASLAQNGVEGRWLLSVILDDGRRLPVFIIQMMEGEGAPRASIDAAAGTLEFSVSRFETSGGNFQLSIQSERGLLAFQGAANGDLLVGLVDGSGFDNLQFIAERTELKDLKPTDSPTREERIAYSQAASPPDRRDRIAALKAFLRKYSQSELRDQAYENIFFCHLELRSPQPDLMQAAQAYVLNASDRLKALNSVASLLTEWHRDLDMAAQLSDEVLAKAAPDTPSMSRFLYTRGRIAHKQGAYQQAAELLEKSLSLEPDRGETATQLAETYESLGEVQKAQKLYLDAFLNSGSSIALTRLERFYHKAYGSMGGLHEMIDQAYEERGPLFQSGRYQGPKPNRTVLLELFTGSECAPCQASDYAFDGLLEHYPTDALAAVQYHLHIPMPDPMTNSDSVARAAYYSVHSTPGAFFSGTEKRIGGGPRRQAEKFFQDYRRKVAEILTRPTSAEIAVSGRLDGDVLQYQATVQLKEKTAAHELRVRLLLVESVVHYTGYNGVHFHRNVVRRMLGGVEGKPLPLGQNGISFGGSLSMSALESDLRAEIERYSREKKAEFRELTDRIDRRGLRLVAFLQNEDTKEILEAVIVPVEGAVAGGS